MNSSPADSYLSDFRCASLSTCLYFSDGHGTPWGLERVTSIAGSIEKNGGQCLQTRNRYSPIVHGRGSCRTVCLKPFSVFIRLPQILRQEVPSVPEAGGTPEGVCGDHERGLNGACRGQCQEVLSMAAGTSVVASNIQDPLGITSHFCIVF